MKKFSTSLACWGISIQAISLMYIGAEILKKILANQIQQCVKTITHHDQVRFTSGMLGWFNLHKSINVMHHINKLKRKYHTIISVDAEKAFYKIQPLFMIKIFSKLRIEGSFPNLIKNIYKNSTAKIILNDEKLETFTLRSGTR